MKSNHPEAREVAEDVSDEQAVKAVYPDATVELAGPRNKYAGYYILSFVPGRIPTGYHETPEKAWSAQRSKLKPDPTPTGSTCQYCSDYGCQSCPPAEPTPVGTAPEEWWPEDSQGNKLKPCGVELRFMGDTVWYRCSERPQHAGDHRDRNGIRWRQR